VKYPRTDETFGGWFGPYVDDFSNAELTLTENEDFVILEGSR